MRDVNQHFEVIEKAIEYSAATDFEIDIERTAVNRGIIDGVLYFADGARLEFTERIIIVKSRIVKLEYRYQFVRGDETIFRYDNAPHHEQVSTHPHHKHVGAKILPAIEPEFRQVLDEVAALLLEAADEPSKKRRPGKPHGK